MAVRNYIRQISLIKTICFNLHYFGLRGFHLPVLIARNVILKQLGGKVILNEGGTGIIKIGFDGTGICDIRNQRGIWYVQGEIHFEGKASIAAGVKISCGPTGKLSLGNRVSININSQVICMNRIHIGKETILSWDDLVMDSDFHEIVKDGISKPKTKPIYIGDHVWIGCRSTLLKGTKIPESCIIAANSTIAKQYDESNCIIQTTGILRKDVNWKR